MNNNFAKYEEMIIVWVQLQVRSYMKRGFLMDGSFFSTNASSYLLHFRRYFIQVISVLLDYSAEFSKAIVFHVLHVENKYNHA